jgi:hypothetical protein
MGFRKPHSQDPRGRSRRVSSGRYWRIEASWRRSSQKGRCNPIRRIPRKGKQLHRVPGRVTFRMTPAWHRIRLVMAAVALLMMLAGVCLIGRSEAVSTSTFFRRLTSTHRLARERLCGRSPEDGDGTRKVFSRGVSCRGRRHAGGESAIGIVTLELSGIEPRGWSCTAFETRNAYLLCYRGKDRTGNLSQLNRTLTGEHIRAIP